MKSSIPVKTAMSSEYDSHLDSHETFLTDDEKSKYCSIVGSFIYIALKARPDICLTASVFGKAVEKQQQIDMVAAIRTMRYLN